MKAIAVVIAGLFVLALLQVQVCFATLGVVSPLGGCAGVPGTTNCLYFNGIEPGSGVYHGYDEAYSETIDSMMPCNAFLVVGYKEETPPTPFLVYGKVNDSTDVPVLNPDVTITNLNTYEVFTAETKSGSNYYQILTSSRNVSAGDVLHFCASNANNTAEFNHTVTEEEMNNGDFEQNVVITIVTTLPFDTGQGDYPSIRGTHTGTITPNQTMEVHRMYTYPCFKTDGHSEYARFDNATGWSVEASWIGTYLGPYQWIEFNTSFTLKAGVIYNYTIITECYPQYPQIHHTQKLDTGNGTITCTEFVDANGRRYNDGIPAIRLFL